MRDEKFIQNVRKRLEVIVSKQEKQIDVIISSSKTNLEPEAKENAVQSVLRYNNVIWGINRAYEEMCREAGIPYEPVGKTKNLEN